MYNYTWSGSRCHMAYFASFSLTSRLLDFSFDIRSIHFKAMVVVATMAILLHAVLFWYFVCKSQQLYFNIRKQNKNLVLFSIFHFPLKMTGTFLRYLLFIALENWNVCVCMGGWNPLSNPISLSNTKKMRNIYCESWAYLNVVM